MNHKALHRHTEPLFRQAMEKFKEAKYQQSEQLLQKIVKQQPNFAEAWNWLGLIACEARRFPLAAKRLAEAITLCPNNPVYLRNLGKVFDAGGRLKDGIQYYEAAVKLMPQDPELQLQLGRALRTLLRLAEAEQCCRQALELKPDWIDAMVALGEVLSLLGRHEDAVFHMERAIEQNPENALSHMNLGIILSNKGDLHAAKLAFERSILLQPENVESHNHLGSVLVALAQTEQAAVEFDRALQLQPEYHIARWNLSLAQLMSGDYAAGFCNYEARRRLYADKDRFFYLPEASRWRGGSLSGKRILVWMEQGQGDQLQMARYLPMLKTQLQAQHVQVCCSRGLVRLFEKIPEVDCCIDTESALPEYDLHCSFMDFPWLFRTSLHTIPATVPYLHAEADEVATWKNRIGNELRLKVGLVWAGGKKMALDNIRSLSLPLLDPLFRVAEVRFFSLQKYDELSGKQAVSGRLVWDDWMDDIEDFAATAALIDNLDLVISVDTSVAHLAGAMGKPVWLLNRFSSEWRWMHRRDDSPWYPSMRIYRQQTLHDWSSAIQAIASDLQVLASANRVGSPI